MRLKIRILWKNNIHYITNMNSMNSSSIETDQNPFTITANSFSERWACKLPRRSDVINLVEITPSNGEIYSAKKTCSFKNESWAKEILVCKFDNENIIIWQSTQKWGVKGINRSTTQKL